MEQKRLFNDEDLKRLPLPPLVKFGGGIDVERVPEHLKGLKGRLLSAIKAGKKHIIIRVPNSKEFGNRLFFSDTADVRRYLEGIEPELREASKNIVLLYQKEHALQDTFFTADQRNQDPEIRKKIYNHEGWKELKTYWHTIAAAEENQDKDLLGKNTHIILESIFERYAFREEVNEANSKIPRVLDPEEIEIIEIKQPYCYNLYIHWINFIYTAPIDEIRRMILEAAKKPLANEDLMSPRAQDPLGKIVRYQEREDQKKSLRRLYQTLQRWTYLPPAGITLHGERGTGKTTQLTMMAQFFVHAGFPVIYAPTNPQSIEDDFKKIHDKVIEKAPQKPLVFVDQVDRFGKLQSNCTCTEEHSVHLFLTAPRQDYNYGKSTIRKMEDSEYSIDLEHHWPPHTMHDYEFTLYGFEYDRLTSDHVYIKFDGHPWISSI